MTRQNARNFACLDCGAPVGRRNSRCPDCRRIAKSAWNKAYQHRYHAEHRPAPRGRPQADPTLPPLGVLIYDDDGERVQCHACGRFYGSLVMHIRTHGLDAARYKERYDLKRGASLLSPQTAETFRQRALERDQASKGMSFGPDHPPPSRRGIADRLQSRLASSAGSARRRQARRSGPDRTAAILAALRRGDRRDIEIAQQFGVSRAWVGQVRRKHGIQRYRKPTPSRSPHFWTAGEIDMLIAHQDESFAQVAARIGRSVGGVRGMYDRLRDEGRIPKRPSQWSPPGTGHRSRITAEEEALLHDRSLSAKEIAERTGRTEGAIVRQRALRGITMGRHRRKGQRLS